EEIPARSLSLKDLRLKYLRINNLLRFFPHAHDFRQRAPDFSSRSEALRGGGIPGLEKRVTSDKLFRMRLVRRAQFCLDRSDLNSRFSRVAKCRSVMALTARL